MCRHEFVIVEEREQRTHSGTPVVVFVERCSSCGLIKEGVRVKVDKSQKRV